LIQIVLKGRGIPENRDGSTTKIKKQGEFLNQGSGVPTPPPF